MQAQDLLLAYDADFTGYAAGPRALAGAALGGGGDGYYEDFTAQLDHFVRTYPRTGALGGALDWGALVVGYTPEADSDDSDVDEGVDSADDGGAGDNDDGVDGDGADDDGADDDAGDDAGVDGVDDDGVDDDGDDDASGAGRGGCQCGGHPGLVSLGDFITDIDGGRRGGAEPADFGAREMDETALEGDTYGPASDTYALRGAYLLEGAYAQDAAEQDDAADDAGQDDAGQDDAGQDDAEPGSAGASILGFVESRRPARADLESPGRRH